ncbi:hypothetical protein NM688_g3977 [Phlebia brevispora]|uniref:Uncharacterized protein n=1 Tax=Phlebia brevispora TaxID=194682 RepID=A0ACC1T4E8_9APHY|nr:hypothetical protein NM688_g3977 [Phlebia brevispora]
MRGDWLPVLCRCNFTPNRIPANLLATTLRSSSVTDYTLRVRRRPCGEEDTASCVRAGCLAGADPSHKIFVVEAGPHTLNEYAHIQSERFGIHLVPDSKTMTFYLAATVNIMMYARTSPSDFDDWEKFNNLGWVSKGLIPLVKKVDASETYQVAPGKDTRAYSGSLRVSYGNFFTDIGKGYLDVAPRYRTSRGTMEDPNSINKYAMAEVRNVHRKMVNRMILRRTRSLKMVDAEIRTRSNTAHHCLCNMNHSNVTIITGHLVKCLHSISIECKRTVGIVYMENPRMYPNTTAKVSLICARRFIVVSARSLGYPATLECSGIGAKSVPEKCGVKPFIDLWRGRELTRSVSTTFVLVPMLMFYEDHNILFSACVVSEDSQTVDPIVLQTEPNGMNKDGVDLMTKNYVDAGIQLRPNDWELEQIGTKFTRRGMNFDYVGLYYIRLEDDLGTSSGSTVSIELTMWAMRSFVEAGKVRSVGVSECSASTLHYAYAEHPISALQVEYSVLTLDIEHKNADLLRTARELCVTVVECTPLDRSLLTGRYRAPDNFEEGDLRPIPPRFFKECFPIFRIVDSLNAIGKDVILIPGARKDLDEALGSFEVALTPEDGVEVRKLAEAADTEHTDGPWYHELGNKVSFPDALSIPERVKLTILSLEYYNGAASPATPYDLSSKTADRRSRFSREFKKWYVGYVSDRLDILEYLFGPGMYSSEFTRFVPCREAGLSYLTTFTHAPSLLCPGAQALLLTRSKSHVFPLTYAHLTVACHSTLNANTPSAVSTEMLGGGLQEYFSPSDESGFPVFDRSIVSSHASPIPTEHLSVGPDIISACSTPSAMKEESRVLDKLYSRTLCDDDHCEHEVCRDIHCIISPVSHIDCALYRFSSLITQTTAKDSANGRPAACSGPGTVALANYPIEVRFMNTHEENTSDICCLPIKVAEISDRPQPSTVNSDTERQIQESPPVDGICMSTDSDQTRGSYSFHDLCGASLNSLSEHRCNSTSNVDSTFLSHICKAYEDVDRAGSDGAAGENLHLGCTCSNNGTSYMSETVGTDEMQLWYRSTPSKESDREGQGFSGGVSTGSLATPSPSPPIGCISPDLLMSGIGGESLCAEEIDDPHTIVPADYSAVSGSAVELPSQVEGYIADDEVEDGDAAFSSMPKTAGLPKKHKLPKKYKLTKKQEPQTVVDYRMHKLVRTTLTHLLGLHDGGQPHEPPTPKEVSAFILGIGSGPSMSPFRLDYHSSAASLYNQAAFREFGTWFAERVTGHIFPNVAPQDYMTPAYFTAMAISKYNWLRGTYRAQFPSDNKPKPEGHQPTGYRAQLNTTRRRARRRVALFEQRKAMIEAAPLLTPRLKLLRYLLELMGKEGVSSDETDTEANTSKKYVRRKCRPWMNPLIAKGFQWLDSRNFLSSTGQPILHDVFRRRQHAHHADSIGEPMPGLPRNVYDPTFFEALPLRRTELLRPTDDLDLTPLMGSSELE